MSHPPTLRTCEEQARFIARGNDAAIDELVKVDNFPPEGFSCGGKERCITTVLGLRGMPSLTEKDDWKRVPEADFPRLQER